MRRLPLFWLSISLLCGVTTSAYLKWFSCLWGYAAAVTLCGFIVGEWIHKKRRSSFGKAGWGILLLVAFFMGGLRYQSNLPDFSSEDLAYYNDQGIVTVEGLVISDPQVLERSQRLVVQAEFIHTKQGAMHPIHGKVLTQFRIGDFSYGDRLLLSGVLQTPPENDEFSYRDYLASRRVYSLMAFPRVQLISQRQGNALMQALYAARQSVHLKIQAFLPQPEAALLSGILLGIETDIPPALELAFQNTGTAHIIAISGFNMAILAALFLKGFQRWLPVWWAGGLAVLTITLYTLFVGAAPAVQRAALMSSLAMVGALIGRRQAGPFTLVITASVMVIVNPLVLWDAGFQLSVMATLGLILYADRLMAWFQRWAGGWCSQARLKQISGPVGEYFLFTLGAQLMIFPVLLFHFESFSLSSFLANPLILPPQPFVMIFGGIVVLIGLVMPFFGYILSYVVWIPLAYTNRVVSWLAEFPAGTLQFGQVTALSVVVLYLLIFGLTLPSPFRTWIFSRWKPVFLSASCAACALLVWNSVLTMPNGRMKIAVYPQGVLLQTPSGQTVLINPGEHGNTISGQVSHQQAVFQRTLDAVLITSDKQQDYAALPLLLKRFHIKHLLWAVPHLPDTRLAEQIEQTAYQQGIQLAYFSEGLQVNCGDGVTLTMLVVQEEQTVLEIAYENFRMLIVRGGIPAETELQVETSAVVYVDQPEQALTWQPTQFSLVIVPQVMPALTPLEYVVGLNTVSSIEIETDGVTMSLFRR